MTQNRSGDKNLNNMFIGIGILMGLFLLIRHFLGDVQGLICVVAALIVQVSFLTSRVVTLEREHQISREAQDPSKVSEKTVS